MSTEKHDIIVIGSGVGGGSHVYSAMNVRPTENYWSGHHHNVSDATLAPHYEWIMEQMGSRMVASSNALAPNHIVNDSRRPAWMHVNGVAQPAMGFRFSQGQLSNNSFFGSQDNSKVSLDERLLLPLLNRGLNLRDRHEVRDICQTDQGFRLTVMDHQHNRIRTLLARRVVLAAGTLNTLRLLFASRAHGSLNGMPALGQGIGGNGDVPGYWPCNEAGRDYSTGTPCHGRFALQDNDTNLTRYGLNGVDRIPMPSSLRARLKRDLVLVGMGADSGDGSALPAAPGVPPSMTIAAWAGHVAAQLVSSSPLAEQEVA